MSFYSCINLKERKEESSLKGNWIPANIEWKSAMDGDPELEKIKYSSFYTFSFTKAEFIFVGSTNTLGDGDSLILASEPGYTLFYGKWKIQDSIIIAEYKKVYSFLNLPGDTMLKERVDTFILRNGFLIFKDEMYKPYSKIDTNLINSFWMKAREVK
jgi:hypothetical protein